MSDQILLCEPQCCGFEHSAFNAALLQAVLLAYSEASVVFLGEDEHTKWVRRTIERFDTHAAQRVQWQTLDIPPRRLGGWRRLRHEWTCCKSIFHWTSKQHAKRLILCSITAEGLFVLKLWLYWWRLGTPILAIPHSILNSILERQPRRPWSWALGLRQVLWLPHPGGLRYVALGEAVYHCLQQTVPGIATRFTSLEPPCFVEAQTGRGEAEANHAERVRFGYLGVGSKEKGFETFVRLSNDVKRQAPMAEFIMAGFLADPRIQLETCDSIEGISYTPLPYEEYARRVRSISYAVGTGQPDHYHLTASTSFLDALSYTKPGIYLRNPYLQYYFDLMGDIGYLCDTVEEMHETMLSILEDFPAARYRKQRENIQRGRRIFEPGSIAPQLRAVLTDHGKQFS